MYSAVYVCRYLLGVVAISLDLVLWFLELVLPVLVVVVVAVPVSLPIAVVVGC